MTTGNSCRVKSISLLTLTFLYMLCWSGPIWSEENSPLVTIRIYISNAHDRETLRQKNIPFQKQSTVPFVDTHVTLHDVQSLKHDGLNVTVLPERKQNPSLPDAYLPYGQIENTLFALQTRFPGIVHIEKIGVSTTLGLPIWAAKVSDNAQADENEPTILFQGLHHARELIGANVCLDLLTTLCENYHKNEDVTRWLDSEEIWLLPVLNPDGYKYIFEHDIGFPWWRKNLRDNNGDGQFSTINDGVDLNRNYDFNWYDGDEDSKSWFYRGEHPFSENETQAIRNLAQRENFVLGISYHSYGESVLYPWGNYSQPPDIELIVDIANNLAKTMSLNSKNGHYMILPLDGKIGQSSNWMYSHIRTIDYIVEVGREYIPESDEVPFILQQQRKAAFFLLNRLLQTGIKGLVYDSDSKRPVSAEINILQLQADYVNPKKTDKTYGAFYQLVNPGKYTIQIRSEEYQDKVIKNVKIEKNKFTELNIPLQPKSNWTR